jgi:Na+-driven multidrug efflux pump
MCHATIAGAIYRLSTFTTRKQILRLFDKQYKFRHNYDIMDIAQDILIIIGLTSVSLLWVFSIVGGLQTLWDTFGEHLAGLAERIQR